MWKSTSHLGNFERTNGVRRGAACRRGTEVCKAGGGDYNVALPRDANPLWFLLQPASTCRDLGLEQVLT